MTEEKLKFIVKALHHESIMPDDKYHMTEKEIRDGIEKQGFAEKAANRVEEVFGHEVIIKRIGRYAYVRVWHFESTKDTFNDAMCDVLEDIGEHES